MTPRGHLVGEHVYSQTLTLGVVYPSCAAGCRVKVMLIMLEQLSSLPHTSLPVLDFKQEYFYSFSLAWLMEVSCVWQRG